MPPLEQKIVGDIITVEHGTYSSTDSSWTWTQVGKTKGAIDVDPGTEVAESEIHDTDHMDKVPTGVAWVFSGEHLLLATLGGLETLGLYDSTAGTLQGYADYGRVDEANPADGDEAVRVTAYDSQTDLENDDPLLSYELYNVVIIYSSQSISKSDFSAGEFEIHVRDDPVVAAPSGS